MSTPDTTRRARIVLNAALAVVTAGMLVAVGRVAQLQVRPSDDLSPYLRAGVRAQTLPGVRGDLLDTRGRLLSTTRFGQRLVIDPSLFPANPHEAIAQVCEAAELDPGVVGPRILLAQAENLRREENRRLAEQALAAGLSGPPRVLKAEPGPSDAGEAGSAAAMVVLSADSDGAGSETPALEAPPALPTRPIRYTPVSGVLDQHQADALRALRTPEGKPLPGLILETVPVREYAAGDTAAALVGLVGFEQSGLVGAEASFESSLAAPDGRVRFVQDARGNAMWIEDDGFRPAGRGQDLRLSIDLEIQRMAMEELERGVEDADAQGGRIVVLDPASGEILAMGDTIRQVEGTAPYPWKPVGSAERLPDPRERPRYQIFPPEPGRDGNPALARLRCVTDSYEPGSTFKPFVWAIALSNNVVELDEIIDTGGGHWFPRPGRKVEDVLSIRAASRSWHDVLVYSSNVGMSRVALRLSPRVLHDTLARWGFGRRLDIGLPYKPVGQLTSIQNWKPDTTVSVSFGYEVLVTPLHMVRAFSAFARQGELSGTIPTVSLLARDPRDPHGDIVERVLSPEAAAMVREPLEVVAQRMERHVRDTPEGGWRYRIFGKSGTANAPLGAPPEGMRRPAGERNYYENQYMSSFLAAGPVEHPRLVILCIIDDPGPGRIRVQTHYGSYVAGPVVRRLFDRALEYLGVPESEPVEDEVVTPG
jgi:cell division protein FtsI (penicillin-binding protein 3)